MLIVATDTICMPDVYREQLEQLGELLMYEGRPDSLEDFLARIDGADIAIVTHFRLPASVFENTTLKLVALARTGYDDVDIDAAARHGVAIANAPGYSNEAVAEHVFAMLLSFLRKVREADRSIREGCFECMSWEGRELAGRTMGVIGTGRIGVRVAEIASCFGMDVLAYDVRPSEEHAREYGFRYVGLDDLYERSDCISVHLPLLPSTEGLIGREAFARMRPTAVLVNTARGPVIDETALLCALEGGLIAGACLDVFNEEPLPPDSRLPKLNNVLLTPHVAYNTVEAREKCMAITVENIRAFLAGKPQNILNPDVYVIGADTHG